MKELTDLEICKRIAEIEGIKTIVKQTDVNVWDFLCKVTPLGHDVEYNPLKDDGLIKRLMFGYEVTIIWSSNKVMMYYKPNVNPMKTLEP